MYVTSRLHPCHALGALAHARTHAYAGLIFPAVVKPAREALGFNAAQGIGSPPHPRQVRRNSWRNFAPLLTVCSLDDWNSGKPLLVPLSKQGSACRADAAAALHRPATAGLARASMRPGQRTSLNMLHCSVLKAARALPCFHTQTMHSLHARAVMLRVAAGGRGGIREIHRVYGGRSGSP